jgi:twitching motility protein PilT
VNVFYERDNIGIALRTIPQRIPKIDELGLPVEVCKEFSLKPRGIVLVTGPTGSGKSTSLAAMINFINENRPCNIITIEDPIEYKHVSKTAMISQREVGADTVSFARALRSALRQDPDVILLGEMRDLETISTALTAAETGHLVFATLHTNSAVSSVDRIIDVFPSHQQAQIRLQLSMALQGILSQTLLPRTREMGGGRVVAVETLVATHGIRNMIREAKTHQLPTALESGSKWGMKTLDMDLKRLVLEGKISLDTAISTCHHPEEFRASIGARSG